MTRQSGNAVDTDYLLQGNSPSGVHVENFSFAEVGGDLAALTSGVMTTVAVPCQVGDVISTITFKSGATAAGTPTNQIAAIYGTDLALLAQSADKTTEAWAANTAKSFALASEVLCTAAGVYYVGLGVTATTVPTLLGRSVALAGAAGGILATHSVLARTHGSAVGATAPATITGDTTVATVPYVVLT